MSMQSHPFPECNQNITTDSECHSRRFYYFINYYYI